MNSGARPGPSSGRLSSGSTSSLIAVMPVSSVASSSEYTSLFGQSPETSTEPSSCTSIVALPREVIFAGRTTVQRPDFAAACCCHSANRFARLLARRAASVSELVVGGGDEPAGGDAELAERVLGEVAARA